jgi:N-acylglucosamine-6-phosphate 2-epimerase
MTTRHPLVEKLRGGLIVSCQAGEESPVHGPRFMAAFARAAELGGAVGLRVDGAADVRACRRATGLPIIGINKVRTAEWPVYITPSVAAARVVVRAGAEVVALDATHRPRSSGLSPEELIRLIKDQLGCLVMADVDSLKEGLLAAQAGADLVATTMAGYTPARPAIDGPDLALVCELARRVTTPVICEGRIRHPADLAAAFAAGAHAVVVGTAITNPIAITRAFALATPRGMA